MMLRATAIAAAAIALACAPVASAGGDSYIQVLRANGIPAPDAQRAIAVGRQVCDQLYAGTPREVVSARMHAAEPTQLTGTQADIIAFAAQRELCPDTAE